MSASTRPAEVRRSVASRSIRASQARPNLHVVESSRRLHTVETEATRSTSRRVMHPFVRVAVAISFLAVSLMGSLMLRTQMVQDSFEVSRLQTSIGVLTQDVQDDQAKLDALDSSLPDKAEKLGMTSQSSSVSLDLSEYIKSHPQTR